MRPPQIPTIGCRYKEDWEDWLLSRRRVLERAGGAIRNLTIFDTRSSLPKGAWFMEDWGHDPSYVPPANQPSSLLAAVWPVPAQLTLLPPGAPLRELVLVMTSDASLADVQALLRFAPTLTSLELEVERLPAGLPQVLLQLARLQKLSLAARGHGASRGGTDRADGPEALLRFYAGGCHLSRRVGRG